MVTQFERERIFTVVHGAPSEGTDGLIKVQLIAGQALNLHLLIE